MKPDKTQFRQALGDPVAGTDSDLYKAVKPLISADPDMQDAAAADPNLQGLHEDVRKGLVGLEYLTGLKQNSGETFYDEHPTQAVATDALKHSVGIGAGVAGLGVASNMLKQHRNMKKTEPASMSREKNPTGDRKHPLESLHARKDKAVSPELAQLFGDIEKDPETRLKLIDRLQNPTPPSSDTFHSRYSTENEAKKKTISDHQAKMQAIDSAAGVSHLDPKTQQARSGHIKEQRASAEALHKVELAQREAAIKKIIDEAHASEGFQGLGKHVDFHHSLQDAQQKGGFGKYWGEGLNTAGEEGGKLQKFFRKFIAPSQDQGVVDLGLKRKVMGQHPHMDKELTRDIIAHNLGIDPNSERMRAIMETGYDRAKSVRSGIMQSLVRHRTPILAGAGLAAGGVGLYKLIKAIQNQAYPDDQVKEWKKTLLKSRGDFEGADQIQ